MPLYDESKRIPELVENTLLTTAGLFPWYDPATDTTYCIPAGAFIFGLFSPGDAWNPDYSYELGEISTSDGQVWISNGDDNLGNPPGPLSAFWTLEPDAPTSEPLEDGEGTTANGNSVDLGGTMTANVNIDGGGYAFGFVSDGPLAAFSADTNNGDDQIGFGMSPVSGFGVGMGNAANSSSALSMLYESVDLYVRLNGLDQSTTIALDGQNVNLDAFDNVDDEGAQILIENGTGTPSHGVYIRAYTDTYDTKLDFNSDAINIESGAAAFAGAQYSADYSTNFTDRSIPDVGWVNAQIAAAGGGFTLLDGNGTTANGDAADLGGIITGETLLQLEDDADFVINNATNGTVFSVTPQEINLYASNGLESSQIYMQSDSINITGPNGVFAGLQYADDYSAEFTGDSLPNVDWVLAQITAGGFTLLDGSGTTANGDAVDLGGTLTANTTILGDDFNMSILFVEDFLLTANNSVFLSAAGLTYTSLYFETNGITVDSDDPSFSGLNYLGDYSANFTDSSIPNVEYVRYKLANRYTANHTVTAADWRRLVEMNLVGANNLTVPANATEALPIGFWCDATQYGAGQTTIVPEGGVTINSVGSDKKIAAQHGSVTLIKIGTNEWDLFGHITA